nr:hypothetical protein [Tanacetum cinerariifolium]
FFPFSPFTATIPGTDFRPLLDYCHATCSYFLIHLPSKTAMPSLYVFISCLTLLPEPFAYMIMICYHLVMKVPQDYNASSAVPCSFIPSIYVIHCLYIRSLSVMLSRVSFYVLYGKPFKTLCLLNYALMIRHDYDITSSLRRGALQLWYQSQMVNTRTDAELAAAVRNDLQTFLLQIRAEIREEFRTGSGPSGSGGNPSSVTIHTWLERFNKQKPRSFEKATAPV